MKSKFNDIRAARTGVLAAAADAGDSKSHAASPSIDSAGPSIVDRSNPTEFANLALALANNRGTAASGTPAATVTATVYGLVAGLKGKSLLDPDFYRDQRYLRRISFTIGSAASDKTKDGTSTDATIYGFKVGIFDGTDLYARRKGKLTLIDEARQQLRELNADSLLMKDMNDVYFRNGGALDKILTTFATQASIDAWFAGLPQNERQLLEERIKQAAEQDQSLTNFVKAIRAQLEKPRQLALSYTTSQRKDGGADDHRLQLIFDYGLHKRLNWTVNSGLEYRNVYKGTGGDRKGGRFATELQYKILSLDAEGETVSRWVTLDFGAEWKALTGAKPYYKGQAKVTIPLFGGLSLPLVWNYESRVEMQMANATLASARPQGKFLFGLAFDPGKVKALSK